MNENQVKPLRMQRNFLLGALVLQYALGMYANLFIEFPEGAQGASAWQFARSDGVIISHVILGILLLIGAIIFLVRAARFKNKTALGAAIWGLIGVAIAAAAGERFISLQSDAASYVMSLGAALAVIAYSLALAA